MAAPLASDAQQAAPDVENANRHEARGLAAILIVDDEAGMRNLLQRALANACERVEAVERTREAEVLLAEADFDLMIVDIGRSGCDGLKWLHHLREQGNRADVIFITAYAEVETAIDALRAGASDFIIKPFRLEQMLASVHRCLDQRRMARENFVLRRQIAGMYDMGGMVGHGPAIQRVCEIIQRVAPTPSTLHIAGESGTGKELAARSVHEFSGRDGPFVPINCGAISPELLESELFGHVKGAFTGAHTSREGLFTYANGGTLFLDEISEMPLPMQPKLLRVLEERTVRPIGSERETPVDVRVIAATNKHIEKEVELGNFREDLFYRLNVLTITMPPLRERIEDIPELAFFFSERMAAELGVPALAFDHADIQQLQTYGWPGNVRELKNLIERCLLLGAHPSECWQERGNGDKQPVGRIGYPSEWSLEEVEKRHILQVLESAGGNKSEAARRLGIGRKTLERKLHQWNEM
ncbi:MAG: sigma-54-dependent Fis family transcriptional regulator [Proteobacteria bacterium]|nr:MAG: sigma-54-dependent Fis family transcriptional regulator [Pseudomonadota bacterium]QKK12387.1 MAG: sigma-54-dependent Fis family transcriptional regulator [Pseudomonadota bacterium]